jgi:hypothetical protein
LAWAVKRYEEDEERMEDTLDLLRQLVSGIIAPYHTIRLLTLLEGVLRRILPLRLMMIHAVKSSDVVTPTALASSHISRKMDRDAN